MKGSYCAIVKQSCNSASIRRRIVTEIVSHVLALSQKCVWCTVDHSNMHCTPYLRRPGHYRKALFKYHMQWKTAEPLLLERKTKSSQTWPCQWIGVCHWRAGQRLYSNILDPLNVMLRGWRRLSISFLADYCNFEPFCSNTICTTAIAAKEF